MVALAALDGHVAALVSAAVIEDVEGPAHGSGESAGSSGSMTRDGPSNTTRSMSASSSSDATVPGVITMRSASSHTGP